MLLSPLFLCYFVSSCSYYLFNLMLLKSPFFLYSAITIPHGSSVLRELWVLIEIGLALLQESLSAFLSLIQCVIEHSGIPS